MFRCFPTIKRKKMHSQLFTDIALKFIWKNRFFSELQKNLPAVVSLPKWV